MAKRYKGEDIIFEYNVPMDAELRAINGPDLIVTGVPYAEGCVVTIWSHGKEIIVFSADNVLSLIAKTFEYLYDLSLTDDSFLPSGISNGKSS